ASSAYNDRRASCEEGVRLIQQQFPEVKSLRDVTLDMLETHVKLVDMDVYTKCRLVVEENERLTNVCEALEKGDLETVGRQMFRAHVGLRKEYEVSCPELDYLVDYVNSFPDVIGARMMGGGFGGCTINLVKKSFQDLLVERLAPIYKEEFDLELTAIKVIPSNGTELL